jgi:hypothetical protein
MESFPGHDKADAISVGQWPEAEDVKLGSMDVDQRDMYVLRNVDFAGLY